MKAVFMPRKGPRLDSHVVEGAPAAVGVPRAQALLARRVLLTGLHGHTGHLQGNHTHSVKPEQPRSCFAPRGHGTQQQIHGPKWICSSSPVTGIIGDSEVRSAHPWGEPWAHRALAWVALAPRTPQSIPRPSLGLQLSPLLPDLCFSVSPFAQGAAAGNKSRGFWQPV